MTVPALPLLSAITVDITDEIPANTNLLDLVPTDVPPTTLCSWLREGDGLIGWGHAATRLTRGTDRFEQAEVWWDDVRSMAQIHDDLHIPGTGLVTFGSFSFAADSAEKSRLVVPEVIIGRRRGRTWRTTVTTSGGATNSSRTRSREVARPTGAITIVDGSVAAGQWPAVVARAIAAINAGDVEKVVLARDELAQADGSISVHHVLRRLAQRYDATWTFAVDGLVGATPEMLVRRWDAKVNSRVLAGTVRRDHARAPLIAEDHPDFRAEHDTDPRLRLISSEKDLEEHAYAVRSVADALAPHCTDLDVPTEPFVLKLPDVYHLASDISGAHSGSATSLRLAAALHPSAAVCGTPARQAAALIADLEEMDRGRYAGPVGWMDAAGDGDWGIALRCGELCPDARRMRLFAGGGVVAASDPQAELAETQIKMAAMRYALGEDLG